MRTAIPTHFEWDPKARKDLAMRYRNFRSSGLHAMARLIYRIRHDWIRDQNSRIGHA